MDVVSPNPAKTYLLRMNSSFKHQFTGKIYQQDAVRRRGAIRYDQDARSVRSDVMRDNHERWSIRRGTRRGRELACALRNR